MRVFAVSRGRVPAQIYKLLIQKEVFVEGFVRIKQDYFSTTDIDGFCVISSFVEIIIFIDAT